MTAFLHVTFLASNIVLAVLATVFMIARLVAKYQKKSKCSSDDILLLVALILLYICVVGAVIAETIGQLGKHMSTANPKEVERTIILLWSLQYPHAIALTLTRISIAILFLNLFFTQMYPRLRYAAFCCIASALGWLLVMIIINLTHCLPIQYNWKPPIEGTPNCFSYKPFSIIQAVWGLVLDAVIWLLPHFVVWRLQLRIAHKIAISMIFALGLLNIVTAIFRIITLARLDYSGDVLYDGVPAVIWAVAQLSTAISLACCPHLRPLFEKLIPKRLTRINTKRPAPKKPPSPRSPRSIHVTTRIHLRPTSKPRAPTYLHDGLFDPQAPTVVVEGPETPKETEKGGLRLCDRE